MLAEYALLHHKAMHSAKTKAKHPGSYCHPPPPPPPPPLNVIPRVEALSTMFRWDLVPVTHFVLLTFQQGESGDHPNTFGHVVVPYKTGSAQPRSFYEVGPGSDRISAARLLEFITRKTFFIVWLFLVKSLFSCMTLPFITMILRLKNCLVSYLIFTAKKQSVLKKSYSNGNAAATWFVCLFFCFVLLLDFVICYRTVHGVTVKPASSFRPSPLVGQFGNVTRQFIGNRPQLSRCRHLIKSKTT